MTTKEQFLNKHNSLASKELKATAALLNYFKEQKPNLFRGGDYSIDKIRRPFIFWLTSLSSEQKEAINNL